MDVVLRDSRLVVDRRVPRQLDLRIGVCAAHDVGRRRGRRRVGLDIGDDQQRTLGHRSPFARSDFHPVGLAVVGDDKAVVVRRGFDPILRDRDALRSQRVRARSGTSPDVID